MFLGDFPVSHGFFSLPEGIPETPGLWGYHPWESCPEATHDFFQGTLRLARFRWVNNLWILTQMEKPQLD
jgi:hypothetical protein